MNTDLTDFNFLKNDKRIWRRFVDYTEAIIVKQSEWIVFLQDQYALIQTRNSEKETAMNIALC